MFEEFINGKSNAEKLEAAKKFSTDSRFIWMLTKTYGKFTVLPQIPKVVAPAEKLKEPMRMETFLLRIQRMRQTFQDDKANDLIASYLATYPEHESAVRQITSKSFGPTATDLERAIGKSLFTDFSIKSPGVYRKSNATDSRKWHFFKKRQGSLVAVIKMGSFVEVYSKAGNVYRNFDNIRKEFSKLPIDGIFEGQLWYEIDGVEDQTEFLRQTAKKDQSTDHFFEIYDYASAFECMNKTDAKYALRSAAIGCLLKLMKLSGVDTKRILAAELKSSCDNDGNQYYMMADDVSYGDRKSNDFMICEGKVE
jgi:hypothetical protein